MTPWVVVQKIYSKMYLVSCTNTHRDVTDSVNHGMVKNKKTWISWERNIIFLRNKSILNLCLRWHILRSYCFVAEVTFNDKGISKTSILPLKSSKDHRFSDDFRRDRVVVLMSLLLTFNIIQHNNQQNNLEPSFKTLKMLYLLKVQIFQDLE